MKATIHEEADIRMVLQALYENINPVIVSNDTDLLVLLVYIYVQKYRNIYKRRRTSWILWEAVTVKLPHIHVVTGCDTTFYLHGVGKMKVFKKRVNSKETRNATSCNNHNNLLHLGFTLKISIFPKAWVKPSRTSTMELLLQKIVSH